MSGFDFRFQLFIFLKDYLSNSLKNFAFYLKMIEVELPGAASSAAFAVPSAVAVAVVGIVPDIVVVIVACFAAETLAEIVLGIVLAPYPLAAFLAGSFVLAAASLAAASVVALPSFLGLLRAIFVPSERQNQDTPGHDWDRHNMLGILVHRDNHRGLLFASFP